MPSSFNSEIRAGHRARPLSLLHAHSLRWEVRRTNTNNVCICMWVLMCRMTFCFASLHLYWDICPVYFRQWETCLCLLCLKVFMFKNLQILFKGILRIIKPVAWSDNIWPRLMWSGSKYRVFFRLENLIVQHSYSSETNNQRMPLLLSWLKMQIDWFQFGLGSWKRENKL